MTRRLFPSILILLGLLLASPASAAGDKGPYIDGVLLERGPRSDLLVSFHVEGALVPQLRETLESGLPVRFTFWIRIDRPKAWARDEVLVDLRLTRTLEKNNLQNRFHVTFEDGSAGPEEPDLARAVAALGRVERMSLLPLDALRGGGPAFLRIRARLQEFRLPFRLHRILPFVALWDLETPWYVVEVPRNLP
ncbi:DUF4390 domain-containing protein [Deferrisoma camini]|uniref:DUF4390 domain-containing protein n=1 Tax=Deferrisoma camini TaxID=1035120 RepID=UPI00146F83F2|nr:DUF4390 domain-containing protein [Deferrisoma camini]